MKLTPLWRAIALTGALCAAALPSHALVGKVVGSFNEPIFVTAPAGDKRLFVVEKSGLIKLVRQGKTTIFLDVTRRVDTEGERGLLGLAFDPAYASNGRFYISYIDKRTLQSKIDRYTVSPVNPHKANPQSRQSIMAIDQSSTAGHKAGWIGFRPGDANNLYMSLGDGGGGYDPENNAQNGQLLLGKVLRIDVSGSSTGYVVPADNPFVGSTAARPEIWSLGLRNPYRPSFDRQTGAFWIADVGEGTREEVNFEAPGDTGGHNYGWRLREGTVETPLVGGNAEGLTEPAFDYTHMEVGGLGDCVIGGYVYRGPSMPEADGRYFFGDCISNRVFSITYDERGAPLEWREDTAALLGDSGLGVITSFGEDGLGRLYVMGLSGQLIKMCPSPAKTGKPSNQADICTAN
jgi:glucose/arabinose dehydrogenase